MRVAAVVVAWNRRDLLGEALAALTSQTRPLDAIVVIDNASTDDSSAVAAAVPGVSVTRLERNTGGAGGFAVGVAEAIGRHDADLVWLMDDDTIPTPTALEELLAARDAVQPTPVVCASRVVWTDGQDHPMNTPRAHPFAGRGEREQTAAAGLMPVRSASFVSLLLDGAVIRERGLPIADYFLWNDDFEYSTRLLRGHRGVFAPRSVVVHKTAKLGASDVDPGPRFYNEVRNKVWLFRHSRGLAVGEKSVYLGSSVVRWARTLLRSHDRATLRDGLRRGLRDGFRAPARDNRTALADQPAALAALDAFERAAER